MRIAVIGAGPVGLAASTLLAHAGHEVIVYERAPVLEPVGAGLLIQPTGLSVLEHLGIRDELEALGHRVDRLRGESHRGRIVLDARYERLRSDLYGLGLHRAALSAALDAARAEAGAELRTGVSAKLHNNHAHSVELHDSANNKLGSFDLVVGCDGARSQLRSALGLAKRDRRYPWGALWCVTKRRDASCDTTLSQVYRGTREMIGFLPSGRPAPDADETISIFWSVCLQEWEQREVSLDSWQRRAIRLAPHHQSLIEQVTRFDDLILAPYRDVNLRRSYQGRVVLLGDAAHAMSPQLGQGVNLGLLDAAALTSAIGSCRSLDHALRKYEHERRANIRFYQRASRWLTPVFQSNIPFLGAGRDAFFGPLTQIPFIRRQALLSLAGVKTGVFTHDPLP